MTVRRVSLRDFRSWEESEFSLADGVTVVRGRNGSGKTNLLEAIGYAATLKSFRGAPTESMHRLGTDRAVVRAELVTSEQRNVLIETEIVQNGRNRTLINKQPLKRGSSLSEVLRVSVFSPEDLRLVKGGPGERRDWLDDAIRASSGRSAALLDDVDRVLRQRNALLKQVATVGRGRLDDAGALTLDVWDAKFVETGSMLVRERCVLLARLIPLIQESYAHIADAPLDVLCTYGSSWLSAIDTDGAVPTVSAIEEQLRCALEAGRSDDVRRGVSTAGPHRDDVNLALFDSRSGNPAPRPARTHASQGEQRTLALAMRLSVHRDAERQFGDAPLLLLDDVFSELDAVRSSAFVRQLPAGQALLASAIGAPPEVRVDAVIDVELSAGISSRAVGNPGDSVDSFAWDSLK
jgi:DNA replication and repair protein RecF